MVLPNYYYLECNCWILSFKFSKWSFYFSQREEAKRIEQEFTKNWEESRQGRVDSWNSFRTGKSASSSSSTQQEQSKATPAPPSSGYGAPAAATPGSYYGSSASSYYSSSASGAKVAPAPTPAPAPPVEKKKKKEKQRFSPMGFRPPKHKPESR
jgi:hypothetical protein